MTSSIETNREYLDRKEYESAVHRFIELKPIITPWIERVGMKTRIKNEAPEGYDLLLEEYQELGQKIYYTDWMNGCVY